MQALPRVRRASPATILFEGSSGEQTDPVIPSVFWAPAAEIEQQSVGARREKAHKASSTRQIFLGVTEKCGRRPAEERLS